MHVNGKKCCQRKDSSRRSPLLMILCTDARRCLLVCALSCRKGLQPWLASETAMQGCTNRGGNFQTMSDICGMTHIRCVRMLTYQAKDTAIWEVVRQLCKGFALQEMNSFGFIHCQRKLLADKVYCTSSCILYTYIYTAWCSLKHDSGSFHNNLICRVCISRSKYST